MQSTSPPPPPPYASKHTIIAPPPAVSNRFAPPTSPTNKLPVLDSSGHRVSTALNITFSPLSISNTSHNFLVDQPRHHTVQRVWPSPPPAITSPTSVATSVFGTAPTTTEWKPGICSECGVRITNVATACQALGCFYHDKCFVCCCCQRTLRGKTFYKDQDKIYCEEDYLYCGFQRMAEKCTVCGHIIAQTILQAMGKSYHPGCFRCTICNKCMDGQPFTVDQEGRIYCLYDFYLTTAPTCAACANPILPDSTADEVLRVVSMNKEFHIDCYRCEDCSLLLSEEVSSRCYPFIETGEGGIPGRIHLLCLNCHLTRIGATPAPGQNLEALLQQRRRRGSNGSSSLASSFDMGAPGSASPVQVYSPTPASYGNKPSFTPNYGGGGGSSPYSAERRTASSMGRPGYYANDSNGR